MCLRSSHHKAMRDLGLTDEEIEADFQQVLKDLDLFHDWLREKAEAQQIKEGVLEEAPW